MIKRIQSLCIYAICIAAILSCQEKEKTLADTLHLSVEWIWKQQSPDGGWHSQTHAVLRDGRVLTPYILYHLLQLPVEDFPINQQSVDKAADFIVKEMHSAIDEDSLTLSDYPNYSAAYSLRVLHKLNIDTSLQEIIAQYLLDQQFLEHRGFTSEHLVYGGWGYGEADMRTGEHGHVDISHTRRIAEALLESGYMEADDSAKKLRHPKKAKEIDAVQFFIKGVQRHPEDSRKYEGCISRLALPYDGGFVASVVTISTIKSEPIQTDSAGLHYPSYATATCDGLMLMNALNMKDTPYFRDAENWLKQNQQMHTIDGISPDDPEQWDEVMHYYHLAVRSEAMNLIDPKGSWRDSIGSILTKEQHPGGYYVNPIGGVNKEDDPLMATIFCIQALANVRV